jgi:DNA-binding CsgD family transcriptional regulator
MFDVLGLDVTAENVYRVMLSSPESSIDDISERLNLDKQQILLALDRLTELSLLRPSWDVAGGNRVISPEVGLHALLAKRQSDLLQSQQRLEQSRAAVEGLIADSATFLHRPDPDVERLEGIGAVRERLVALAREVKEEVAALQPGGPQSANSIASAEPVDEELLGRGVRMFTVYLVSMRSHPPTTAYARFLNRLGGQVRLVPSLPVRMILFDRSTAVLPIDARRSNVGVIIVRNSGTLAALCALFDQIWADAIPFGQTSPRNDHNLTPQEYEVLRFLAQGLTDGAIASRLGVSVRTSSRIAAHLMTLLDARSRFQAGSRASELGWLTDLDLAQ